MIPEMDKFVVLLIIMSLLISLSFLGGADLLIHHFCSTSDAGGFCGVLHGMSRMISHLSFIETLLAFLPVLLAALVVAYYFSSDYERILENYQAIPLTINFPVVSFEEQSWLAYHINSPNIF
jgi:hypothetical protein